MGQPINAVFNSLSASMTKAAIGTVVWSGLHAVTARLFTSISPLSGGVFGATFAMSNWLISNIVDPFIPERNLPARVAKLAGQYFSSLVLGFLATHLVGIPIAFDAALLLHVSTYATVIGGGIYILGAVSAVILAWMAINAWREGISFQQSSVRCVEIIMQHIANLTGMTMQELQEWIRPAINSANQWIDSVLPRFLAAPPRMQPRQIDDLLFSVPQEFLGGVQYRGFPYDQANQYDEKPYQPLEL